MLHYQKRLSKQQKRSSRSYKTKVRLSKKHSTIANIRDNFCHQVSRKLVDHAETKSIIFEDLGIKRMTKKPKIKQDEKGKYLPNRARAKAGLNKGILDKNWYKLEQYTKYKAHQAGKSFFKVAPNYTSQECANCHHIHPNNRKNQSTFQCIRCGHTDNADFNAAKVIKLRAIQLLLNSGTELSSRGVLSLGDIGRGADVRHRKANKLTCAVAKKR
ncbi:MAG: transposase [Bacteroidota bacterium]